MPRRTLYSSARAASPQPQVAAPETPQHNHPSPAKTTLRSRAKAGALWMRSRALWMMVLLLSAVCAALVWQTTQRGQRVLTQKDIDAAVMQTLQNNVLPSQAAKAYENVRPSVVRVVSFIKKSRLDDMKAAKMAKNSPQAKKSLPPGHPKIPGKSDDKLAQNEKDREKDRLAPDLKVEDDEVEFGVGTGVVIVDKGIILTNWHVVQGADRIKVTFMDGLEAEADIKGVQAEDDLAVLQARKIPDDLIAATMRSTADLTPGDQVIAVGFPFGIGPSTSAGVVSGLKRSFRSPDGGQTMKNLIQFDAAANPGNSGGPLVTMDGEVVGIVTAIMNPTPARTFIGIGFAVPIENAASAAGLPPF
jgi:S1-C subfamily serine protease